MGLCANYCFLCWGFVWLELSLALCMVSWLLWVRMDSFPVVSRKNHALPFSILLFLSVLYHSCTFKSLFLKDPWTLEGKGDVQFIVNHSTVSFSSRWCVSVLTAIYCKKKSSTDNRYDFKNLKRMSVVKKNVKWMMEPGRALNPNDS